MPSGAVAIRRKCRGRGLHMVLHMVLSIWIGGVGAGWRWSGTAETRSVLVVRRNVVTFLDIGGVDLGPSDHWHCHSPKPLAFRPVVGSRWTRRRSNTLKKISYNNQKKGIRPQLSRFVVATQGSYVDMMGYGSLKTSEPMLLSQMIACGRAWQGPRPSTRSQRFNTSHLTTSTSPIWEGMLW